jgi:hypothetical protein
VAGVIGLSEFLAWSLIFERGYIDLWQTMNNMIWDLLIGVQFYFSIVLLTGLRSRSSNSPGPIKIFGTVVFGIFSMVIFILGLMTMIIIPFGLGWAVMSKNRRPYDILEQVWRIEATANIFASSFVILTAVMGAWALKEMCSIVNMNLPGVSCTRILMVLLLIF